ncbi:MAG: hypothetical protein ABI779_07675 [Acidobacteriota bacterium]
MTPAAILAATTFTIAFEGLLMVQTEPSSEYRHLAIVDASDYQHKVTVEIWRWPFGSTFAVAETLVQDDRVSFENVPRGEIETDELYERHVPHLPKHVEEGGVHSYVIDKVPTPGVFGYVDLPGGSMTTFGTFKDHVLLAKSFGRKDNTCFARFVVLEPNASTNDPSLVITHAQGETIKYPIREGDLVIVSNTSKMKGDHFHLYTRLLTPGGELRWSKVQHDQKPECVSEASQDTRYEVKLLLQSLYGRVPNGDCGAVGNP